MSHLDICGLFWDYSGENPDYPSEGPEGPDAPLYLGFYTDALDKAGYAYDIWDVDRQGVPSHADVLSHYDVAIWYTGDDYAPTVPNGFVTTPRNPSHSGAF